MFTFDDEEGTVQYNMKHIDTAHARSNSCIEEGVRDV